LAAQVAGFTHAPAPYCYRCPFHLKFPDCGLKCAEDIEELIQTTTTGEIAAFMSETILGVGGCIVPPPGYFERAVQIARNHGGLFIVDEVQAAWGRTGGKWFGIEHWDVEPDILTSAKGLANGAPIGLTIATPEVADSFASPTIATFGGNPVSTAAALAVIKEIEDKKLRENAAETGAYLKAKLEELKERHSIVGDVRGMGLMVGVELVKDKATKEPAPAAVAKVLEETKRRRVLIGKGGLYGNVLRLGPPLIATRSDIDELVAALDAGFSVASA
jgi:4-aminobutyrate aminotransferase